jgi:hypothetical protein
MSALPNSRLDQYEVEWRHPEFGYLRRYFKTKRDADTFAAFLDRSMLVRQYKRKRK